MAIHKTDNGTYVSSSGHTWLPGVFADERAARYAFRLKDETLFALQEAKNSAERDYAARVLTFEDLQAARRREASA